MSLFKILKDSTLERIDRHEFKNEQELHSLIEKNLSRLMGVSLIASEYPIPNGRIDTLGLDEDGVPVIIEYKWKKDLSAIVQGLFYLDWVMQNKKPFESIVKDKLNKDVNVNWSTQPRLVIIAQDFDTKELAAINQMGPSVELVKYSLYKDLFNIENVNIIKSKTAPKSGEENGNKYTWLYPKFSKVIIPSDQYGVTVSAVSYCMEINRNLCRDIDVANCKQNHVCESI